jgi:DNA polymerase-3 subunit delta
MAKLTLDKFKKAVKQAAETGEFSPIYFIYGPEERRVKDATSALKDALLSHLGGEENYFRYQRLGSNPPEEVEFSQVVAQLNTVSMFGGGKLVWLGPLESIDKKTGESIIDYCNNPNPGSSLLISYAPPKGDGRAISTFEKSKAAKELLELSQSVKIATAKGQELVRWLITRFKSFDKSIDQQAAQTLVELCSGDMDRLDGEVLKLSSFVGDAEQVTMEDIESTVGDHRTEKIWDLTRAFGQKDLRAAQGALTSLMDSGVPAQVILKTLTTELNRLAAAVEARDMGMDQGAYANELGEAAFMVREAWAGGRNWSISQAKSGLSQLLDTSINMMKSGVSPETALNSLLVKTLTN